MTTRLNGRAFARGFLFVFSALALAAVSCQVQASTFKKLHDFCNKANCADGSKPVGALLRDAKGNLYGVASQGGDNDLGVVFELVNKAGVYQYKRLYSFCAETNCADGSDPAAGVIRDVDGNLYGTTASGGAANSGVVYRLSRKGVFEVLYNACHKKNCKDGSAPVGLTYVGAASGTPYDGISTLYGVNAAGGVNNCGVIFRLDPVRARWSWSALYAFCSPGGIASGHSPNGDILADSDGNVYGTTLFGGLGSNGGALFKIDASGTATGLYSFCSQTNCEDGRRPNGAPVKDAAGVFHGTTSGGGIVNQGVVFTYSTQSGYSHLDFEGSGSGSGPSAGLTMDPAGHLFGTTTFGGPNLGNIFEVFDQGMADIFDFCGDVDCGSAPVARMISDSAGNLYGTTFQGGANPGDNGAGAGVIFEFTP